MICEAHINILTVNVALCMCLPGGHYHEKVHGALMHLSGAVKIEYLLGSRSLNALPARYYASYSLQALILFTNTLIFCNEDTICNCWPLDC